MSRRNLNVTVLLAGAATIALMAGSATPASADTTTNASSSGGVEMVTVTARKVSENQQDVPIAMTALQGGQIDVGRSVTLEALNNIAPNLQVFRNVNASNAYIIYIRGEGRNNAFFNVEPEVALYIDDVYYPYQVGMVQDLDDIDHVEVLNGPQGTLYGRNATVGAVRYVTRHPDLENADYSAAFTTGSFGRAEGQGSVSVPIIDGELAGKIEFSTRNYDGFVRDLTTGETVGGDHTQEARAQLLWQPEQNVSVLFNLDGLHANDPIEVSTPVVVTGGKVVPLFGSWYETESGTQLAHVNNLDVLGGSMQATWNLDDMVLKSISSYRVISQDQADHSQGRTDVPQTGNELIQHAATFTQELQATGALFADRFTYAAGVFYLNSRDTPNDYQPSTNSYWRTIENTESFAVYVNGTYKILDNWDVTLGGRGTWDTKTVQQSLTVPPPKVSYALGTASQSWSAFTYSLSTDYHITNDIMAYVSFNTGFKGGQVSTVQSPNAAQANTFIPPETDRSLEGGLKTSWFGNRLVLNADYYYTPYKNLTTALLNTTTGQQYLAGADARMQGFELQMNARPTPEWNISATLGTISSRYVNVQPGGVGYGLADETLQHAPHFSTHLWTDYTFEDLPIVKGNLTLGMDYQYTTRTYESANHALVTTQEAYDILGFDAIYTFQDPRWEVVFQGTNVTNTVYFLLGSTNGTHFVEPPAEYTLSLKFKT